MKLIIITVIAVLCLFAFTNSSTNEAKENNENYDISQNFEKHDTRQNCRFCKWLINNYKWGIDNSLTVNEVQKSVLLTCEIFNKQKKDSCISFFLGIGREIIGDILKNENTVKICQRLNICNFANFDFLDTIKMNLKSSTPPNFYECKTCKKNIEFLEKSLNTSLSPDFVLTKLKNVCDVFKKYQKQNCIVYYEQFGIQIIRLLLISEKPEKICQLLSYCKRKDVLKEFKSNSLSTTPSDDCKICKIQVSFYEETINDELPIVEIQKFVIGVCDIYNSNMRQLCISFYSGVGLQIINAIVKKEDPTQVCQILNLCLTETERNQYMIFTDVTTALRSPNFLDNCTYCVNTITWLEMNMDLSKTPEEVRHILLGFCEVTKCPYHDLCIKSNIGVGFEIVKYILNKTDPTSVCKHFQFCASQNVQSSPLKAQLY